MCETDKIFVTSIGGCGLCGFGEKLREREKIRGEARGAACVACNA